MYSFVTYKSTPKFLKLKKKHEILDLPSSSTPAINENHLVQKIPGNEVKWQNFIILSDKN